MLQYNPSITGSLIVTGSINASQGITGSLSGTVDGINVTSFSSSIVSTVTSVSSSLLTVNGSTGSYATTGSNTFTGAQTVQGTLTAQTLVVQTVTSSVLFSTGSNKIGSTLANVQELTGSVGITGSLTVNGALSGTSATFSGSSGAFIGITVNNSDPSGSSRLRVTATGNNITDVISYSSAHASRANQAWIGGDGSSSTTVLQAGGVEFLRGASTGAVTITAPSGAGTNTAVTYNYAGDANYTLTYKQIVSSGLVKHTFDVTNAGTAYANNLVLDRGNVGIGTASPSTTLEVSSTNLNTIFVTNTATTGTTAGSGLGFQAYNGTSVVQSGGIFLTANSWTYGTYSANQLSVGSDGAGGLALRTASAPIVFLTGGASAGVSTERMRVNTSGNVGIGTASPSYLLDVRGTSAVIQAKGTGSAGSTYSALLLGSPAVTWNILNDDAGPGGDLRFYNDVLSADAIRIKKSSNYVGIGTTSPTGLVHLYGSDPAFRIQSSTTGNMQMGQWDGTYNRIQGSGRDFLMINTDATNMLFSTNATERMRITYEGNIQLNSTGMLYSTSTIISIPSSATTIFTSTGYGGVWLVTYAVSGNPAQIGYAIVGNVFGSTLSVIASAAGSQTALSASGLNLQLSQSAGGSINTRVNVIRLNTTYA